MSRTLTTAAAISADEFDQTAAAEGFNTPVSQGVLNNINNKINSKEGDADVVFTKEGDNLKVTVLGETFTVFG